MVARISSVPGSHVPGKTDPQGEQDAVGLPWFYAEPQIHTPTQRHGQTGSAIISHLVTL